MWTLSQWGWPLCGLFLVLVSMEISLCSSRLSDEDGEALMKRAEHFNDSNYTRLMRVAVMGAKNYEPVLFGLTDETLFQCVPMGVGSPTICMISGSTSAEMDELYHVCVICIMLFKNWRTLRTKPVVRLCGVRLERRMYSRALLGPPTQRFFHGLGRGYPLMAISNGLVGIT
eukprot:GHVS01101256.1.p2 GENE.GHVS01101256.1~~GHVS01101256.1.p2  ORF type:complete len:172 (+),score=5.40 GHVS01101256.1:188-703(+)